MSTRQRLAVLLALALSASGCGKTAPSSAAPASGPSGPPAPTTPAVVEEDLTTPDVKLTPVAFVFDGVPMTIQAPQGAKMESEEIRSIADVLYGKDCSLHITRSAGLAEEKGWWKKGTTSADAKRYLIEQPDTLLLEANENSFDADKSRVYLLIAERELGGVKYTVGLCRPGSARRADLSTKAECLLALKCVKTLALKTEGTDGPGAPKK